MVNFGVISQTSDLCLLATADECLRHYLQLRRLVLLVQNFVAMAENMVTQEYDELTEALNDLFTNVSTMIKGDLQGTNNVLKLLETMNLKVAEEYEGFGDVASGLRVFVDRLKAKSENFDEYVQQIDAIEQQVTDLEVVISMLDKYVSLLESKVQSVYKMPASSSS
ncbi:unnamed protein product [Lactuca virosa]|uniref:Biogenesis of lysosome-related organelles complex 1 subunit 2 n=1 Tax=Lactuca virosa TaxID=75947 RepID=A0AAU9M8F0_9ASTR|nr:unnamed protein product [Lactuca virosa]